MKVTYLVDSTMNSNLSISEFLCLHNKFQWEQKLPGAYLTWCEGHILRLRWSGRRRFLGEQGTGLSAVNGRFDNRLWQPLRQGLALAMWLEISSPPGKFLSPVDRVEWATCNSLCGHHCPAHLPGCISHPASMSPQPSPLISVLALSQQRSHRECEILSP